MIRNYAGINDRVDHSGVAYRTGEYTELAVEITVTGGSAALKHVAAEKGSKVLLREVRAMTRQIERNGAELHHLNPLRGHPGGSPALFPTAGLPASIHSGSANLKLMTHAEHVATHRYLRSVERTAKILVNPLTTSGRFVSNRIRDQSHGTSASSDSYSGSSGGERSFK